MYEVRPSGHPLIRSVWRAGGDEDGSFVDVANECWGIAFTRHADGRLSAELAGPAAEARPVAWHAGEAYWGAELESHAFWRGLDKLAALGGFAPLPVDAGHVVLGGVRYPIPDHAGLEALVAAMVVGGVLVGDPLIAQALAGEAPALSERALQRRFKAVAGVGRKRIEQIERARRAYALLQAGMPAGEAAFECGYADQAHLTRSLRVFAGQTPRRILLGDG